MTDKQTSSEQVSGTPLLSVAALIAAVACLVLASAALVFVYGRWQERQTAIGSNRTPDLVVQEQGDSDDATTAPVGESGGSADESSTVEPSSAQGEAPIVVPGADVVAVVEDWRDLANTGANVAEIERNLGAGEDNGMTLHLLDPTQAPGGQGGLAIEYEIGEAPPDDFVGFNRRHVPSMDWRGATHLALWAAPTDTSPRLVVQFRESSGEVWRHGLAAADIPSDGLLFLALDADTFDRTEWSSPGNGMLDVSAIDQYGIYFGHVGPVGRGTLLVGPIAAVRR